MKELEAARQRLEESIGRLEATVDRKMSGDEISIEDLRLALEEAQQDYAQLLEVTRTVSNRLDTAIARLKTVLEEERTG